MVFTSFKGSKRLAKDKISVNASVFNIQVEAKEQDEPDDVECHKIVECHHVNSTMRRAINPSFQLRDQKVEIVSKERLLF
jgi:hypothetical protein